MVAAYTWGFTVNIDGLKNIVLRFFPPSTTAVLQPCDMRIIKALKAYFRHEMRQKTIDIIDGAEIDTVAQTVAKRINVIEAMYTRMIKSAWMKISRNTIKNCWTKAGLVSALPTNEEDVNDDRNTSITLPESPAELTQEEFDAWVAIDDNVPITQELSEEEMTKELVTGILETDKPKQASEDDRDDSDDEEEPTPTAAEMRRCLHRIGVGFERLGFDNLDDFYSLKSRVIEELRKKCPPKQLTMDQFVKL